MSEVAEPRWLTVEQVIVTHERQIKKFGGPQGLRDQGMLESALARPENKWRYESADLAELAASHAFGIAKNRLFVDGNKRVAFLALVAFLRKNGVRFAPPSAAATAIILALAAGEVSEESLARWIRDNWPAA